MSFIAPWDAGDERWVPWAVAAVGIFALAAMAWIRRRPLVTGSPEALAGSCRASFFIGVGPGRLHGAVRPRRRVRLDIERRQREIRAAGSPLSLLDALVSARSLYRGQGGMSGLSNAVS